MILAAAQVIYHFLNGESDTGSALDPSGSRKGTNGFFADFASSSIIRYVHKLSL